MSSNNQSSTVSSNQLTELVRAIVQTVVSEMERPWHGDAHNLPNLAPHDNISLDSTAIKMATKLWGEQGFDVYRAKESAEGHVFLMRGNDHKRYGLWKGNDGSWKYLQTPSPGVKKWVDVPADKLAEMTGTGAVAGFASPMAFSKRKVNESEVSDSLTEYEVKDDEPLEEMTTTGAVDGYNVPSAFSGKGGSKKGVAGSAALGYTLTAAGEKEMQRKGDRLLENEQPVRKQRCSKCGHLKPTDANGYIEGWECYDCRKGGVEEVAAEKPDFYTQRKMALDKARREKNVEAVVYYTTLMQGNSSANVDFERFKGSWAYEQWVKNPVVAQKIADKKAELARYPYTI
jgi:hypothetical protein